MPRRALNTEIKVRDAIKEYLDKNGMTTLHKIAEYVEEKTGVYPSANTVGRHVDSLNIPRRRLVLGG